MKSNILTLVIFFGFLSSYFSQILAENNVYAVPSSNPGNLFVYDQANGFPSYIVPQSSGLGTFLVSTLWCSALNDTGGLHLAGGKFMTLGHDYFNGPYSTTNSYTDNNYITKYGTIFSTKAYPITKNEVVNHIWNYNQVGYVMPQSIALWPANGDISLGVEQNLAPFVDMNNNGTYEPLLGDYPDIRGDKAIYQIINDARGIHTETGGVPLGIEIHLMYYQFSSNDYKNDATYLNIRVFNRGLNDYAAFKLGIWASFEFGAGNNDYVGCDTTTNLAYI